MGTIASAKGGTAIWDQTRALIPGLGVGLMWAVLMAAIGLVLASFTGRRAYSTGIVAIACVLTFFLSLLLIQAEGGQSATDTGARVAGLFSPFTILDGVRVWLGGNAQTGFVADPGRYGPLYGPGGGLPRGQPRGPGREVPEVEPVMTIELRNVSRWYGNVVAVNDITMSIEPGVTGLLGPNGAGKSTIMHMIAGFLPPSRGELTIAGQPSWRHPAVYRQVGLVPERDSVYAFLTGEQFVTSTAKLHELPDPDAAAARAIAMLDMADAADRKIATYSKGMRQRIKVAAALVHDPEILLLDEPFNGMDPRQRLHMMDLLDKLGSEGRTILFSSHILEEVERLSGTIQVVVAGRLAASGDFRAIRRLMTSRPHVFTVRSSDDRRLGGTLIGRPAVTAVELTRSGLQVRTSDYGAFCRDIAVLARDHGIRLREVLPTDESLESVFAYLVAN